MTQHRLRDLKPQLAADPREKRAREKEKKVKELICAILPLYLYEKNGKERKQSKRNTPHKTRMKKEKKPKNT